MAKLAILIMAAGAAKRFGSAKQLAKLGEDTMLNNVVKQYSGQGEHQVYVALGAYQQQIKATLPSAVKPLYCPTWQLGLGHNISHCIALLENEFSHVMIALGDQLEIDRILISKLVDLQFQYPQRIIASQYAGQLGAPCSFPRAFFSQLKQLTGDKGAKRILKENSPYVLSVDMPQAQWDIDCPEDLLRHIGQAQS